MPSSFAIPKDITAPALARARKDGLSLSSVVRLLLAGYANGRIAIAATPAATPVTVEQVEEIPMAKSTRALAARAFKATARHAAR